MSDGMAGVMDVPVERCVHECERCGRWYTPCERGPCARAACRPERQRYRAPTAQQRKAEARRAAKGNQPYTTSRTPRVVPLPPNRRKR